MASVANLKIEKNNLKMKHNFYNKFVSQIEMKRNAFGQSSGSLDRINEEGIDALSA